MLVIFVGIFLVFTLFKTQLKGSLGEKEVSSILYLLDDSKYKVFNDIVLNVGGKTTQIDHLIVSDFGLFVIETKNYKGWIFGSENSEYWTQALYNQKHRFYNPIRQNFGHIVALKNCLCEFHNIKYISIVVFLPRAEIKVNTTTAVTYTYGLLDVIRKHADVNLTEHEKDRIFRRISCMNSSITYDKALHIKSVNQTIEYRERSIKERKCPQCGGDLILREGKFGKFLGCSTFPKCKFSRGV